MQASHIRAHGGQRSFSTQGMTKREKSGRSEEGEVGAELDYVGERIILYDVALIAGV